MPGAPGATLGTEGCDSLQGDAELCPRAVNTCSACDAPSTMEALPREEMVFLYLPDTGWPLQAWRRIQCTPDLQQLKAGVAGPLHPSNGLQVDDLSQWHFTEPQCGWC